MTRMWSGSHQQRDRIHRVKAILGMTLTVTASALTKSSQSFRAQFQLRVPFVGAPITTITEAQSLPWHCFFQRRTRSFISLTHRLKLNFMSSNYNVTRVALPSLPFPSVAQVRGLPVRSPPTASWHLISGHIGAPQPLQSPQSLQSLQSLQCTLIPGCLGRASQGASGRVSGRASVSRRA